MHLLDLFESAMEGYTVTRGIDKDRYQARSGLEGPFQTKSGKVVYYDKKEGKYYDPDTDMYIDYDDYRMLDEDPTEEEPAVDTPTKQPAKPVDVYEQQVDEGAREFVAGALLAGLLGLGVQQLGSLSDAKNSPLGRAMAQAAEQGDEYAAKHLKKLDFYYDANDTGSIKVLSKKYLGRVVEGVVSEAEVATTQKTQRMVNLMRARYPEAKTDLEALLLHFNTGQRQDRQDISTLYSQNDQEEMEIDQLQAALDKLKARAKNNIGEAMSPERQRALDAAMANIEKQFGGELKKGMRQPPSEEEVRAKAAKARAQQAERSKQRMERAQQLIRKYGVKIEPGHEGYFLKGVDDGRSGIVDRRAGDAYGPYVNAYDAGVSVGTKMRSTTNEDYYDSPEQRELARLGRILMDMGVKRDDAVGEAMSIVGSELTNFGTATGATTMRSLERRTGQPQEIIYKMMALAKKVPGDVARGEEVPDDEEEVKEIAPALGAIARGAAKAIGGAVAGSIGSGADAAGDAAGSFLKALGKLNDDVNKDFDKNFSKRIGYTVRGGAAADMMKKQAAQAQADNPDAGKGLGPGVLDVAKAREKAAKRGIRAPGSLRASPNTRDPKRLPEGLDHDIRIGDRVETRKMGQMQGVVTGFSTKYGSTKVMFKHESGKVYATPASNLRVIDSVKKTEGLDNVVEAKKKPVPTKPDKWAYAKAEAKKKFDVYPSAYANAWAAKKYKELGGGWRMGTPKK